MAKRTRFAEYKDRYANYRFELSPEGILLMQCHTKGGSLVWDWKAHDEMSDAFADIAGDREIKVLIHTGTGENYNADWGPAPTEKPLYLAMDGPKGLEKLASDLGFASRFYRALCVFMADRMRQTTQRFGYGKASDDTRDKDELNDDLLDNVHLAGARFDRMLKRLAG